MRHLRVHGIELLIGIAGFLLPAASGSATTFYISKSTGSDTYTSSQAQNKNTPWAHLPGMASCAASCAGYTPTAGDTFVLKGCDIWVNADLPINWSWSGTSGNPITVTVDKTWYNSTACPSSWNRPILDGQKQTVAGGNRFLSHAGTSWVIFDNIEWRGLHCTSGPTGCGFGNESYIWGNTSNWTYRNLYLHGWDIDYDANCVLIGTNSDGNLFTTGVIDGSDRTSAVDVSGNNGTCEAFYSSFPNVTNSVIHDLANGIVGTANPTGSAVEFGGNRIYNITESNTFNHPNAIEITGGAGKIYIHDNVIYDIAPGAQTIMFGNIGDSTYIWNNVIYSNNGNGSVPTSPQIGGSDGGSFWFWNNTIFGIGDTSCLQNNVGPHGTIVIQNNLCITTNDRPVDTNWSGSNITINHNLAIDPSKAAGYASTAQLFVYRPLSPGLPTEGEGVNLAFMCVGPLAGLCSDTSYACTYNSSSQSVTCPARTSTLRPGSGVWDIGAYLYPIGEITLLPPTSLAAVAR